MEEMFYIAARVHSAVDATFAHWEDVPDVAHNELFRFHLQETIAGNDRFAFVRSTQSYLACLENAHTEFRDAAIFESSTGCFPVRLWVIAIRSWERAEYKAAALDLLWLHRAQPALVIDVCGNSGGTTPQAAAGRQPYRESPAAGCVFSVGAKRQMFPDGSRFEGVGIAPDIGIDPLSACRCESDLALTETLAFIG